MSDFSLSRDTQSDYQSLAYIPQKLPEELKKRKLYDYFFLDSIDLDYSISSIVWRKNCIFSNFFACDYKRLAIYQGEKLWKFSFHELAKPFEILFLDEPSNDLDILRQLIGIEARFKTSQTVIFISPNKETFFLKRHTIVLLRHWSNPVKARKR